MCVTDRVVRQTVSFYRNRRYAQNYIKMTVEGLRMKTLNSPHVPLSEF